MLEMTIVLISLYISVVDLISHRISHYSLILLSIPLLLNPHGMRVEVLLMGIAVLTLLTLISSLGGGDFKLLLVLLISQGSLVMSLAYLQIFLFVAFIQVVIFALIRKGFQGAIPLAPSILAPFLLCYLAI